MVAGQRFRLGLGRKRCCPGFGCGIRRKRPQGRQARREAEEAPPGRRQPLSRDRPGTHCRAQEWRRRAHLHDRSGRRRCGDRDAARRGGSHDSLRTSLWRIGRSWRCRRAQRSRAGAPRTDAGLQYRRRRACDPCARRRSGRRQRPVHRRREQCRQSLFHLCRSDADQAHRQPRLRSRLSFRLYEGRHRYARGARTGRSGRRCL